jgi:SM-20-related protein
MPPTFRPFTDADADHLAADGYVIMDDLLGHEGAQAIRAELQQLLDDGAFRAARVGHGAQVQQAAGIRSDRICWFNTGRDGDTDSDDGVVPGPAVRRYLEALDVLRVGIARACFLSLGHVELHAACYEPGTRYAPHVDTFRDDRRRVISVCYYLNDDWQPEHGGCLRLHTNPPRDVEPRADRLVIFQSGTMLHEVLPVHHRRFSTTGWMGSAKVP